MMHSSESVAEELRRLRHDPSTAVVPPVLARFVVDVFGDSATYVERLRSGLSPSLRRGHTADFEADTLPVDDVPDWFVAVSSPTEAAPVPEFARNGRDAYREHTGGRPWDVQDWLYRFDPDDDSRGWEWWGVTQVGPSRVHVWVDSWGESFFGCQDLLWVAYTAGALHVDGPTVQRSATWAAEAEGGTSSAC